MANVSRDVVASSTSLTCCEPNVKVKLKSQKEYGSSLIKTVIPRFINFLFNDSIYNLIK